MKRGHGMRAKISGVRLISDMNIQGVSYAEAELIVELRTTEDLEAAMGLWGVCSGGTVHPDIVKVPGGGGHKLVLRVTREFKANQQQEGVHP